MNWRSLSVLLFGIALFYAPLAYGCTTNGTALGLNILLLMAAAAALIHKVLARESFHVSPFPLVCVLILAAIGAAHVFNARFEVNEKTLDFIPRGKAIPFLPSALDRISAHSSAFGFFALAAAFLVLIDLMQHRNERWKILGLVAISGFVVALLGICLKLGKYPTLPFSPSVNRYFFATYVYHGNAAAFLNLCWPAALALLGRSIQEGNFLGRAFWANGFLFTFGALFVNASKFGHAMAIPAVLLGALLVWRCIKTGMGTTSPVVIATTVAVVLVALTILILPMLAVSTERWGLLVDQGESSRPITYGAALRMIPDAPLWGIGPGCFRWGFPFYTAQLGDAIKGVWIHAHQDYIETFVEWGIIGGMIWVSLLGTGIFRGWSKLFGGARELSTVAAVVAISVTLVHCMVDFPLQIPSLRYLAAIYFAILWGSRAKHRRLAPE